MIIELAKKRCGYKHVNTPVHGHTSQEREIMRKLQRQRRIILEDSVPVCPESRTGLHQLYTINPSLSLNIKPF